MSSSLLRFATLGLLCAMPQLSGCTADQTASLPLLEGVWTGEDTNGFMFSSALSIKLTTNGQGALLSRSAVGITGTFTYTRSVDRLVLFTNDTPRLTGVLRYEAAADMLVYQESASVAKALHRSQAPVLLIRDTNEMNKAELDCMIGATNYHELMTRLVHFSGLETNDFGSLETKSSVQGKAQQFE